MHRVARSLHVAFRPGLTAALAAPVARRLAAAPLQAASATALLCISREGSARALCASAAATPPPINGVPDADLITTQRGLRYYDRVVGAGEVPERGAVVKVRARVRVCEKTLEMSEEMRGKPSRAAPTRTPLLLLLRSAGALRGHA